MVKHTLEDNRSHRVIFLSHCVLNQNAKVYGIAKYPGTIKPIVELLLGYEVGIYQMPCPEMAYLGTMRWGQVRDQYDSPMFRRHCQQLATSVMDQAEDYRRAGYDVLGFIMIDGSPVCGLNVVPVSAEEDLIVGGMVWYTLSQNSANDRGVFCEVLQKEAATRGMDDLPFLSIPEVQEIGSMDEAIAKIKALLEVNDASDK